MTALPSTFCYLLPMVTVQEVITLWQDLAKEAGHHGVLLSQEKVVSLSSLEVLEQKFWVLLSHYGNALLQTQRKSQLPTEEDGQIQVCITLDERAIADFLEQNDIVNSLSPSQRISRQKQQDFQIHLLRGLLNLVFQGNSQGIPMAVQRGYPCPLSFLQSNHDRVVNYIITQIRQSLDLPQILEKAVVEVRNYLQSDRLIIYQFLTKDPALSKTESNQDYGKITYEARQSQQITSVLNLITENDCFPEVFSYKNKYLRGEVTAINDIEKAYSSSYCLVNLLNQYEVKASLMAPIIVDQELWGLLIAHQRQPRQWLASQKTFLGQIGEHLAIAIKQAQLYAEVQHQKENFEKRVIERTQDLRDTLLAAQAASHLKSEFLDNISHELRTPLTCIIGLSGTLLHWFKQGASLPIAKQQQYLQMIQESGKHLMDLISDIIELSQLESGRAALNFQIFSLLHLAQQILHRLDPLAREKRIHLKLDYQIHSEQDTFCADPERIEQMLFHLLSNAIKFTPTEGRVTLRIWKEQKQAIFQVEDTGIGITETQMPQLFQAFKHLEDTQQRTYESTGLGLALTKQLVELHSGTIEVDSTPGQGSVFTLFIPYQNPSFIKNHTKPKNPLNTTLNNSVVVIEKNEEIATLICELLTAADYQVIWLIDTANAVKQVELLQPSIVLIDQDFDDVARTSHLLKESHQINTLKVILLSETISSLEWQHLSRHGIDDYILKPLQPDLLLQRLKIINREQTARLTSLVEIQP